MAKLSKLMNTQKSKKFWAYIVVGILLMVVAIVLAPFWDDVAPDVFFADWGMSIIQFVIAGLIMLYVCTFLLNKIRKGEGNRVVKVLVIIETVLLTLIALGCILAQFKILNISDAGKIIGFALWLRGTCEIFRAYYFRSGGTAKYPVWWLAVAIIFVTLGVVMFVGNYLSNVAILWALVIVIFLIGLIALILGIFKKPVKNKK